MYRPREERPSNTTIGRGDPEWERKSKELVRSALIDQRSPYALDSELEIVRDESMKNGRIDHYVHVGKTAQRLYDAGRIHLRADVRDALDSAIAAVGEYDARGISAEREIIRKAIEAQLDSSNVDDLTAVIVQLGQNKFLPRSASDLAQEQQIRANVQEEFERNALIARITLGKPQFSIWSPRHGKAMPVDSSSLEYETTERLREICNSVENYRAIRDGKPIARVVEQVDEGITATERAPKHVELENDEFLAFPGDPSREYSAKEAKANLRELMFYPGGNQGRGPRRVAAINRLLSGRKFGE